ncbi:hypothetical protein ARHIZOSPH14_15460 [Agromyces rhizosphaerae]|uniref:Alpha/beta hydrolase n=1 Tax=Agromyces rhizosphaerae TaxID=88374 RepID=A0A9W6CUZ7_9MICO|nr:hypothetical protein [Agromyces rhizosphaerae]GLI27304.1 hypothetical protein ARHIZOSPH14_15460 [Agromyces rhizosphaerae]
MAVSGLAISGGGTIAVSTGDLLADAALLGHAERVLGDWQVEAARLRHLDPVWAAPLADAGAGWALVEAERMLGAVVADVVELRAALVEAAERYGVAERAIAASWEAGGRLAAWTVGRALPAAGAIAALHAPGIAVATGLAAMLGLDPAAPLHELVAAIGRHPEWISDPRFVALVRTAVGSADELAVAALGGVPVVDAGVAPTAAAVLTVFALTRGFGTGALVETPVRIERMPPPQGGLVAGGRAPDPRLGEAPAGPPAPTAPIGIAGLAERVPADADGARIRVERYGAETDPRWVVYIGGTVDTGLVPGAEPFDMTSNLHAVAERESASERAVRAALAEAGAAPGDPVVPVGYSQGGIVAARLAASGDLAVPAVVSLGGPIGQVDLPDGVRVLSLEHDDDLVPALGGPARDEPNRVTVSRDAFDPGTDVVHAPGSLPAHDLDAYRRTAELVDVDRDPRLAEFTAWMDAYVGRQPPESSVWRATRE